MHMGGENLNAADNKVENKDKVNELGIGLSSELKQKVVDENDSKINDLVEKVKKTDEKNIKPVDVIGQQTGVAEKIPPKEAKTTIFSSQAIVENQEFGKTAEIPPEKIKHITDFVDKRNDNPDLGKYIIPAMADASGFLSGGPMERDMEQEYLALTTALKDYPSLQIDRNKLSLNEKMAYNRVLQILNSLPAPTLKKMFEKGIQISSNVASQVGGKYRSNFFGAEINDIPPEKAKTEIGINFVFTNPQVGEAGITLDDKKYPGLDIIRVGGINAMYNPKTEKVNAAWTTDKAVIEHRRQQGNNLQSFDKEGINITTANRTFPLYTVQMDIKTVKELGLEKDFIITKTPEGKVTDIKANFDLTRGLEITRMVMEHFNLKDPSPVSLDQRIAYAGKMNDREKIKKDLQNI